RDFSRSSHSPSQGLRPLGEEERSRLAQARMVRARAMLARRQISPAGLHDIALTAPSPRLPRMRHCHLFPLKNLLTMPPSASSTSRVEALDLLRLVAVLGVLLYHFGFWGPASHGVPQVALPWLAPVAKYGFLGVPGFFVISGFVIAYSA